MRTCIKSRTSSNFDQIGPPTTELAALERQKNSRTLIIGNWCLHASSFIFDRIIIKFVAGNQDRHKSSVEFDFGPNQTTHFGVTCPWVTKISLFWTWISLKPVGQSWSNFMNSIIGVGERLHKVLGADWIKILISMATESPHWLTMGKMMSTFSRLFFIQPFWKDQIWPWQDSGERPLPFGLLVISFAHAQELI